MTSSARVLAVDLGAASVRVASVDLAAPAPSVEVLHRWRHAPVPHPDGTLRWDWDGIRAEVEQGLAVGLEQGPVASIGIDGWAIDYGLVDADGKLLSPPFSYRDSRTDGWRATAERIGVDRLYQTTGVQLMAINTIFQLAAHDRGELDRAARLLLLPDLLGFQLGGFVAAERSNVSTTGLMNARTGDWSDGLIGDLGLDRSLFPEVAPAGRAAGAWRGVPIHLVGSHDTASAFLGMPGASDPNVVFMSTGSWVVVGIERPEVDTSPAAFAANFSNEAGALGGVRFLKNVVGLWILERCRAPWRDPPIELLVEEAAAVREPVPTFDAGDHRFVNPRDMEAEVREASGLPASAPRGIVTRCVLESIVDGIGRVVEELVDITGAPLQTTALVGGGAQIALLPELIAERTGLKVIRGSSEATALGNAAMQGIALGRFADLAEARAWLDATGEPL